MTTSLLSLRQIALVTRDLEESLRFWTGLLDLEECYRDDLSTFGLSNVLLPVGEGFLELLQSEDRNSAGARFLDRHGEGLYMTIFEGTDAAALKDDLAAAGIPLAFDSAGRENHSVHMHPKAMGRVLYSVEHPRQAGEWSPAGFDWKRHVRTDIVRRIVGVGMITPDAEADAERFTRLFGLRAERVWEQDGLRIHNLPIGGSGTFIEFQQPVDAAAPAARYLERHGPGMYYWALETPDLDRAVARAKEHGVGIIRVEQQNAGGSRSAWLHPRTTHGALTELIERR